MAATSTGLPRPDADARAAWKTVLPLLIPPVAWIASLGLSWLIQDFTCTSAITSGRPVSGTALFTTLMVMNAVLFLITVVCGLLSVRSLRRGSRSGSALVTFLGVAGIVLSVFFAFGIAAIGATPVVLEVC